MQAPMGQPQPSSSSVDSPTLNCIVDLLWADYDQNNNGTLDKKECKNFINLCLQNFGSQRQLSDAAFDEIFATYDTDGNGTIEKSEMKQVIRNILDGPQQ